MKYLVLLLLCLACGGDDFKKVEELKGFRVLGIQTSKPEVLPGEVISDLKVIFSDPESGGRQISATTVSCIDPGIAFGAKVDCSHDPARVAGAFTIDTSEPTNGFFTGVTSNSHAPITIPATIFLGRSAREQFNGVGYIIIFNFLVDGQPVMAFRRIVASNRGALNTNPAGSALLLNGAPASGAPAKNAKFSISTNSQESYDFLNIDGTTESREEEFQVAWYVSKGKVDKPKTFVDENVKYLDDQVAGPFLTVAIIRDERGGIEFLQSP